ncbi:MAG: PilZ domain-containing protein [Vicinamibacterales bacterium]
MARGLRPWDDDRRHAPRVPPRVANVQSHGIVRPGHDVHVLNLASGGALVECGARLRPGSHTELQVVRDGTRVALRAVITRCRVARLAPLVYEAALCFEQPLSIDARVPLETARTERL